LNLVLSLGRGVTRRKAICSDAAGSRTLETVGGQSEMAAYNPLNQAQ
jgi:hypothetical protein